MVRTTSGELHHYGSALRHLAEAGYGGTVGVVTPFRQQMIRLKDTLEAVGALPREFIERTDLHIDTAYGFQGGERDLILFSLCGGPDVTPGGVWFFREDKNQFNVAVSRARAVLHIVGNRDWALASGFPHLEKLASRTLPGWSSSTRSEREPQSPWQIKFAVALQHAGISTVLEYPIAGRFLDIAVLGQNKLDIEVDGESVHRTARGGRKDDDYWRDLQLQRLGWKVRRFWVYELREKMERCVAQVKADLNEGGK
jgi:very-short-patch-repair endonuclease